MSLPTIPSGTAVKHTEFRKCLLRISQNILSVVTYIKPQHYIKQTNNLRYVSYVCVIWSLTLRVACVYELRKCVWERAGREYIPLRHNDGKSEKYCIMRNFIVRNPSLSWIEKKLTRERKRWTIRFVIFVNKPIWCTFLSYMFIFIFYMFRAAMHPSSGELIVSMRHPVYVTLCRWPSGM